MRQFTEDMRHLFVECRHKSHRLQRLEEGLDGIGAAWQLHERFRQEPDTTLLKAPAQGYEYLMEPDATALHAPFAYYMQYLTHMYLAELGVCR